MTRTLSRSVRFVLATLSVLACDSVASHAQVTQVLPAPPRPQVRIPAPPPGHSVLARPLATQLRAPLWQYVRNPESFRRLVSGTWRSGEFDPVTRLQFDAVAGVETFLPSEAGEFGTVIARVTNQGSEKDQRFHVLPGATVYLVVHQWHVGGSNPVARIEVAQLHGNRLTAVARGEFRICHYHARHTATHPLPARFGGCEHATGPYRVPGGRASGQRGPSILDLAAVLEHTGEGNVHCGAGCCEVAIQ